MQKIKHKVQIFKLKNNCLMQYFSKQLIIFQSESGKKITITKSLISEHFGFVK